MPPPRPALSARGPAAARPGGLVILADGRFRAFLVSEVARDMATVMRLAAQSWLVLALTDSSLWVGIVAGVSSVFTAKPMSPAPIFDSVSSTVNASTNCPSTEPRRANST